MTDKTNEEFFDADSLQGGEAYRAQVVTCAKVDGRFGPEVVLSLKPRDFIPNNDDGLMHYNYTISEYKKSKFGRFLAALKAVGIPKWRPADLVGIDADWQTLDYKYTDRDSKTQKDAQVTLPVKVYGKDTAPIASGTTAASSEVDTNEGNAYVVDYMSGKTFKEAVVGLKNDGLLNDPSFRKLRHGIMTKSLVDALVKDGSLVINEAGVYSPGS